MERVVLLRHAKSSWSDSSLEDHDRPLSERGVSDARRIAKYLQQQDDFEVDLVLCSSAVRARQTWAQVEKRLSPRFGARVTRELYLPTRETLLRCLKQVPAQAKTVLIVGHNPSIEAFALAFARKGDAELRARLMEKFPTAGLCVIEVRGSLEAVNSLETLRVVEGTLASFVTPKDLLGVAAAAHAPSKAAPIELGKKARWRNTALRVFEATTSQLRENLPGARQGEDSEYVHQTRVAVRRLRTALRFFAGVLPEGTSDYLRGELRWLFGLLGPLREYDVVLEQVLSPLDIANGLPTLRKELEKERRALLARFAAAAGSARYERFLKKLLEQQASLAQLEQGADSAKLKPLARKRLDKRLRKVERLQPAVDAWLAKGGNSDSRKVNALHALRKELKKLRYACDFVHEAFPKRAARKYLRRMSTLQDVLGELQDHHVSERLLSQHLKAVPDRTVRANLRAHVQAPLSAGTIRAAAALAEAWEDFKAAEPFWR